VGSKAQLLARAVLVALLSVVPALAQQALDWQLEIREQVATKQLAAALAIAERRLANAPEDLEARGWRARLLGWTGQWKEAEAEYRRVLEVAPRDTDLLLGLADVLIWQQGFDEALALLDRAREINPAQIDVYTRQGRALRALGRTQLAREAFHQALALDPRNTEAKAGLASLEAAPRHEFRVGTDNDFFNYTAAAQAQTAGLRSQWSSRWTTSFAGNFYQRFGEDAGKFTGSATCRLSARDALTAGGAVGHDQGVIPKSEAFFEYGRGFRLGTRRFLRGVETGYRQQWFWYQAARILTLTGNVVVYLPRSWMWSLAITAARSRFPSLPADWRPSGLTRLSFPLHRRLSGNVFYGVGTENFALAEQIGRFSARTFGGGARYQFTPRQDVTSYVLYQNRSQSRTQTSFGVSYGLRF